MNDEARTRLERLADPEAAEQFLADKLYEGSLALLLGAGVSKPLGLPSWSELLQACFARIGEPWGDFKDLELAATGLTSVLLERKQSPMDLVRECLYPKGAVPPKDLVVSRRMGALGAMLMGSRRGSVSTVVTFNYDSVLEEYLLLHGFTVNVVTTQPRLTGSEDVTIFHPHGYLPSSVGPGAPSDDIILTKQSVLRMLGDQGHPWVSLLRSLVRSKVILLIGIDADTALGGALGPILSFEAESISVDRPSAVWLGASLPSPERRSVLLDSNVVPLSVGSHGVIDDFLLSICRRAAGTMAATA